MESPPNRVFELAPFKPEPVSAWLKKFDEVFAATPILPAAFEL